MYNDKRYQEFVRQYKNLSRVEKTRFIEEELFDVVGGETIKLTLEEALTDHRFSKGRFCPHCRDKHIVRNGVRGNGTQKYRCMKCGKSFSSSTNTVFSGTHKDYTTWKKFIRCMIHGYSLRKTAKICGVHRNCVFIWRHKVLEALYANMASKVVLDGIIEADETFVAVSYKGNRNMPRPAHKRGKSVHRRGLSQEQVCIYTAVNRNGRSIAVAGNVGSANKKNLHAVFDGKIRAGSYLCSDGSSIYADLAKTNELMHIPLPGGKTRKGIYHIQNQNRYHRLFKKFYDGFNGVSTKYLNHYLAWHNLINYTDSPDEQKEYTLTNFLLTTSNTIRNKEISTLPALPMLS